MRTIIAALVALPILFLGYAETFAQFDTSGLTVSSVSLSSKPEFPRPGEAVEVSLRGSGSDLYGSEIVWRVNGEVVADATNRRTMSFVTGKLGETAEVSAEVRRGSTAPRTYTLSIKPIYIDIVFEPQTRVPDFYQGRALPSNGSQMNATVLFNDETLLDPSQYSYRWRVGNQIIEGGPVRGLNQVSFIVPRGSRTIVRVSIFDQQGRLVGERGVYFISVRPELVFYGSSSLFGTNKNAIGQSLETSSKSSTVIAEPYYLDIRTYNNPDVLEWEINDAINSTPNTNPYSNTIQPEPEWGSVRVGFHVRSTTEVLQGARDEITLFFND